MHKILLADSCVLTTKGYKAILKHLTNKLYIVTNCEQLYNWVNAGNKPHTTLLLHKLPPYNEQELYSGTDCAVFIKKHVPTCKIIIITVFEEAFIINDIIEKATPYALLTKTENTAELLIDLIFGENTGIYYSQKVKQAIQKIHNYPIFTDAINREIVRCIANGYKISEIQNVVFIGESGIQKRVSKMLQAVGVKDNRELVRWVKQNQML